VPARQVRFVVCSDGSVGEVTNEKGLHAQETYLAVRDVLRGCA
jgi:hypothetical protein